MQRLWNYVVMDSRVTWRGGNYSFKDVCTPVSSLKPDTCRVGACLCNTIGDAALWGLALTDDLWSCHKPACSARRDLLFGDST